MAVRKQKSPARPRRTAEVYSADVVKASESDLIWTMPVLDAMRHFGLRHDSLTQARRLARRKRPREVAAALESRDRERRLQSALTVEQAHPRIHARIAQNSESGAEIGRVYGLSRMRISQIGAALRQVAKDMGIEVLAAATRIEQAAVALKA